MIRYATFRLVVLGVVALGFEMTALAGFAIAGARIEALAGLACLAALFARDRGQGLIAAWTLGLLKDIGSLGPMGINALAFLAAAAAILQIRQIVFREQALSQMVVAFVGTFAILAMTGLAASWGAGTIPWSVAISRILLSAALTAGCMPILKFFAGAARAAGR